jgi:hypothetical protein
MVRQRFKVRERRSTTPNGTVVVRRTIEKAPELEWRLQAAAVRRLRTLDGYADEWVQDAAGNWPAFTLAGDFNAGRRSSQESVKAKATGLTPGEADARIYMLGGKLGMIEFKGEKTPVSQAQTKRHRLMRGLGFDVVIIRVATEDEAAEAAEKLVLAWLGRAANDNRPAPPKDWTVRKSA